ncbi:hypothetical protein HELRODRAFT_177560 [Helobdella robusta]|uniref:Uncharacterized protein n=1 Tax=Helobdella robusta TaxID=6412 RepID=T1FBV7_HELRO|nr:hypothetical protein HELRODRAFT_177560 [Helobdella robusta]ESN97905.1 hypothetical protein HELRODRAFT_177560 [Helobdella robusta]
MKLNLYKKNILFRIYSEIWTSLAESYLTYRYICHTLNTTSGQCGYKLKSWVRFHSQQSVIKVIQVLVICDGKSNTTSVMSCKHFMLDVGSQEKRKFGVHMTQTNEGRTRKWKEKQISKKDTKNLKQKCKKIKKQKEHGRYDNNFQRCSSVKKQEGHLFLHAWMGHAIPADPINLSQKKPFCLSITQLSPTLNWENQI